MPLESVNFLAGGQVVERNHAAASIAIDRSKGLLVWRKSKVADALLLLTEREEFFPAVYVKKPQVTGSRSGRAVGARDAVGVGQEFAVGGEGDRIDPLVGRAGALAAEQLTASNAPQSQAITMLTAKGNGGQQFAVGGKDDRPVQRVVRVRPTALEAVDLLAGGCIPEIDRTVALIDGRQDVLIRRDCEVRNSLECELAKFLPGFRLPKPYPATVPVILLTDVAQTARRSQNLALRQIRHGRHWPTVTKARCSHADQRLGRQWIDRNFGLVVGGPIRNARS